MHFRFHRKTMTPGRDREIKRLREKCLDLQIRLEALQEAIDFHRIDTSPHRDRDLYRRARLW